METSAKYISLGPADYRKRVSNTVWVSPTQVYVFFFHRGGPPAGSGNGTKSESSVRERGHIEYVPHSNKETRFYSQYFIVPKKDGGLRPILDL